ncbi:MAG: type II toxin-antitoxin system VapC family toxin, partial [Janthinobacterium lividum]
MLDTHILLWAAEGDPALSEEVRSLIEDQDNTLYFSVVSIWEIVIKKALGRKDFEVDAPMLRGNLLGVGYKEL